MNGTAKTLLIVDAANVVGSVPDGWWRDRLGATIRLRDTLAPLASRGVDAIAEPPLEVVLVVEGAARKVPATPEVRVIPASGSADDTIVELVAAEDAQDSRRVVVVTADRGLRDRVLAFGAEVAGPRTVYPAPD
ncbi:NTP pyrophosphohydrolase [Actinopolymorpha sp. B17G11]|uniref:NTP pyrophosphohydrolase n=1 Tax=unclassified Actinopolymorpha TaxID=2627063 RepID=UPI0032D90271